MNLEVKRNVNDIVHEINLIKEQANKYLLQSSIEIGKRLKEAKEMVGHGNWSKWLEDEVNYSQRTASNLIKIHEEYGMKILENSNSQALANLGYTQAIAMLKLDFEERENFVIENDIDEMTTRELEQAIKEKTDLLKEKEALKRQLEEQTEKESQMSEEIKEKLEKIEEYESLVKEKTEEAKQLKALIDTKSEVPEITPEELEKLQQEVKTRKNEIKELKKQLKEKPKEIEVEVEKIVETIPEDLQEELNTLKVKLEATNSKLNSSENIVKFKSTFNLVVNLFNNMLETLDVIEEEEPEEYGKYKAAVNKFLKQLMIKD
ncbi:hypothetical protein AN1V17_11530 [Vallitalea sediminicola]